MGSLSGWIAVGVGGVLLQATNGCASINVLAADTVTQFFSGVLLAFISQTVSTFFNVPPPLRF